MRYLFCCHSAYGHLFPAVRLAEQLVERGHDVAFLSDPASDAVLHTAGLPQHRESGQESGFDIGAWFQQGAIIAQLKQIVRACKLFKPDVVVGGALTLGPVLFRQLTGQRTAILGLAAYLLSQQAFPDVVDEERALRVYWRREKFTEYLKSAFSSIAARYPAKDLEDILTCDTYLVRSISELDRSHSCVPENVHYIGSYLWECQSQDPRLKNWMEQASLRERKLIYVQPGKSFSGPSYWDILVKYAQMTDHHIVACVSRLDANLGVVPENVFVAEYVPQQLVMASSSLVVSSGTSTPVLGAIVAQLPSILIPAGGEQFDVADNCSRINVACQIPAKELTTDALIDAIDHTTNSVEMRLSIEKVSQALRRIDQEQRGATILERLAFGQSPVILHGVR